MENATMTDPKPSFPGRSDVLAVFEGELLRAAPGLSQATRELWPRFVGYYQGLARLPRRVRRALQRRWRRSLGSLALLLALGQAPALAATIAVDGATCTLIDAISAANNDTPAGGCPAGSGADTLVLPSGSTHTLAAPKYGTYGPTGLPDIASIITIEGNGSTIRRDPSAAQFRILAVRFNGNLTLQETTVSGGVVAGSNNGGGVYNRGTLSMVDCTVSGNSAGQFGGGVHNRARLNLTNSTVSGNSAGYHGGGLYALVGTVTVTESTVSGN
jgi:hypothetical protein